jgi:hypothetical protein
MPLGCPFTQHIPKYPEGDLGIALKFFRKFDLSHPVNGLSRDLELLAIAQIKGRVNHP